MNRHLQSSYWAGTIKLVNWSCAELKVHQYDGDWQGLVQTPLTSLFVLISPHVCLANSMRQFDRTALFIEACLKYGVMEANDTSNILFENSLLHSELFCLEVVPLPALAVCFWSCEAKIFSFQYTLTRSQVHPADFKCSQ